VNEEVIVGNSPRLHLLSCMDNAQGVHVMIILVPDKAFVLLESIYLGIKVKRFGT
jgi:hypothetical protein